MSTTSFYRCAGFGLAALLMVVACNGSDGGGSSSTDAATATPTTGTDTTPLDTGPSTSFNVPQATAETTPATLSTSETFGTTVATDEPPPTGDLEEDVANAAIEATEAYIYAVYNLGAPDALDRLIAATTEDGTARQLGVSNYQALIDNGWLVKPNPKAADSIDVETVTVVDDTTAEVVTCEIDAGITIQPGAGADGSDIIVNDEISAARDRVTIVLVSDEWKVEGGERIAEFEGATECSLR